MRYVLSHVVESGTNHFSNYTRIEKRGFELVSTSELERKGFEDIILGRFNDFRGLSYIEICKKLNVNPYQAKSKYADVCGLIASNGVSKRLSSAEEFIKSGIVMKTIRLRSNGVPKESMSFKNIDYCEVFENDDWVESEAYEIFTNRFLFVVFKPVEGETITVHNNSTDNEITEQKYILDNVFFWTMPTEDIAHAKEYWEHIRENVITNNITLKAFWKIGDNKKFHVRPKATNKMQLTRNPHGGECEKYCYWLNADYLKQIIDNHPNV